MQYTPNYNLTIAEGTDAVNPLTQIFPNFTAIDTAMEDNKEAGITTASEVTTGGVHAIVRVDSSVPVFRFTATSAWTTGDTMTLDGSAVTVHLSDGTAPKSGAYVIGAEVLAVVNSSLVTLMIGATFDGVTSFNSRQGVVTPQSGDYTANMIGYNNTGSGLVATDVQDAIDEVVTMIPSGGASILTLSGTSAADLVSDLGTLTQAQKVTAVLEVDTQNGTYAFHSVTSTPVFETLMFFGSTTMAYVEINGGNGNCTYYTYTYGQSTKTSTTLTYTGWRIYYIG